jgi:hypothetical protein
MSASPKQEQQRETQLVLPSPALPMPVAREFINRHCLHDGVLKLHYWRDGWWTWRGSYWREIERRYVRSLLYRFTEHAVYWKRGKKDDEPPVLTGWALNRQKIGDLLEALACALLRMKIY